jgi:hypothetical protein
MNTEKIIKSKKLFEIILIIIFALIFAIVLGSISLKPSEIIIKTEAFTTTKEIIKTETKTIEKTITETYIFVPPTTKEKEEVYAILGQAIKIENLEITINEVKRANGIITLDIFDPTLGNAYKPTKENYDLFLVNILIKNTGKKTEYLSRVDNFSIVTIEGYVYERKYHSIPFIDIGKVEELSKKYPEYPIINEFYDLKKLDPKEEYSSWIIFELQKDKIVKEITFNIRVDMLLIKKVHVKI